MSRLDIKIIEDVSMEQIPKDILEKVSLEYLLTFHLLPAGWVDHKLQIAVADPYPFYPIDNLARFLGVPYEIALMDTKRIDQILRKLMEGDLKNPHHLLEKAQTDVKKRPNPFRGEDLIRQSSESPVVKMVNSILLEALRERVTDVHFHPKADSLAVYYRRDGWLHELHQIPLGMMEEMVARIKVMAKMDVTQRQLPQDGRFSLKSAEKEVEVRVSIVPTVQGERIVLRLLDRENLLIRAGELGMEEEDYKIVQSFMDKPNGMILVTGPTGSGKTTTLYSFISELNLSQKNVMTIEDPVEYRIEGITQMQVRPSLGLTFAQGLRSVLRQDPDVILVGEIRDQETAQIAIRSALTGHLVLATLHTTDAAGAITRLLDIGIEPYLISSALMAVLSQRLVRKICTHCHGIPNTGDPAQVCSYCFSTGFRGRTGIFELMVMDDVLRRRIYEKADSQIFRQEMKRKGILTLEEAGLKKAKAGITTEDEVLKVTGGWNE